MVLASGAALVVLLGAWRIDYGLRLEGELYARQQFETNAARATEIVEDRVGQVIDLLEDTGNLVAQSEMTAGTATAVFDRFVVGGNILERHPEMDAVAFMRLVPSDEVDRIARQINADPDRVQSGHGEFLPRPPSDLEFRVMVQLIHPLPFSQTMSGFDLMTTPRRAALERAIALRTASASEKIVLFGDRPGLVIYHPVYARAGDDVPLGFTATGFVTDVFIANLRRLLAPLDVDITVYDRGMVEATPLAFSDRTRLGTFISDESAPQPGLVSDDPRTVFTDIAVAGRVWTIAARPAEPAPLAPWMPNLNTGLGAFIAVLIGALIYNTRKNSRRLALLVGERTHDLEIAMQELETRRAVASHQAIHDDLTGLLNRRGLLNSLAAMLARDEATVFSIDLDGFKAINDTRGHAFGDAVLKTIGEKLLSLAPRDGLVARMGGDEFVVAVPGCVAEKDNDFMPDLLGWTAKPIRVEGQEIRIGASIGISQSGVSGRDVMTLVADSDIALYRAKEVGKNQYELCTPELRRNHDAEQLLGEDLGKAIERDEIDAFFQTQHASDDHRIVGAEALVRWHHPERGLIPPLDFLPLAENLGIMREIDARVLDKSLGYMRSLEDQGLFLPKLNVNVSYSRLMDVNLHSIFERLPHTRTKLVFEIVEAVLIDDRSDFEAWDLDVLREKGIGIELDDFGTGHASVVALTQLRPDRIKLDRKFVDPLPSAEYESLVRAIFSMGRAMDIPLTAEGVETEAQARLLHQIGVDTLQGFLFGKPCCFEDLCKALANGTIDQGLEQGRMRRNS